MRTDLVCFFVRTGVGFVQDVLCADLPNLQKQCATIRFWSGFFRHRNVNSHDSDQIPILRCKIGPPFSEFTIMSVLLRDASVTIIKLKCLQEF